MGSPKDSNQTKKKKKEKVFPQAWVRDLGEAYSEGSRFHPALGWKPERPPRLRRVPLEAEGRRLRSEP